MRRVDAKDLVARASADLPLAKKAPAAGKILDGAKLAEVFGIEMADSAAPPASKAAVKRKQPKPAERRKKPVSRTGAARSRPRRASASNRGNT